MPQVWAAFRALVGLFNEKIKMETLPAEDFHITKRARAELSAGGLCRKREVPVSTRLSQADARVAEVLRSECVIWADQFAKPRYSKNPSGRRNLSLATTALALLPIASSRTYFTGLPAVGHLSAPMADVMNRIDTSVSMFREQYAKLIALPLPLDALRCPLDVRRPDLLGAKQWVPFRMSANCVTSAAGLHAAMQEIAGVSNRRLSGTIPLLCDVAIWYSYIKSLYCFGLSDLPMRSFFHSVAPLFGIWHPYKYCVDKLYHAFLPYFVATEYEGFLHNPAGTNLYAFPNLIVKERLILSMYLAASDAETFLSFTGTSRTQITVAKRSQMDALRRLLLEYAPAVLQLGVLVRDCAWKHTTAGTGGYARQCLEISFHLIHKLVPAKVRDGGYKRGVGLALLMWMPYHTALPACAYVEEKPEALLSRLAARYRLDNQTVTVNQLDVQFRILKRLKDATHGQKANITQQCTVDVASRLRVLAACIRNGTVPFVEKKKAQGGADKKVSLHVVPWPENHVFPSPLKDSVCTKATMHGMYRHIHVLLFTDTADAAIKRRAAAIDHLPAGCLAGMQPPDPAYKAYHDKFVAWCTAMKMPKPPTVDFTPPHLRAAPAGEGAPAPPANPAPAAAPEGPDAGNASESDTTSGSDLTSDSAYASTDSDIEYVHTVYNVE